MTATAIATHKAKPMAKPVKVPATRWPAFDELPDSAWARQAQLIRNPKKPGVPVPLPFSAATFWRKIADGTFPKPTKLGDRITAWKVGDVRRWLAEQEASAEA